MIQSSPLTKDYTFDTFVTLSTNQESKMRAIEFAKDNSNNVLVISAKCGNGSTHLAKAILNKLKVLHPDKPVFYTSFEKILKNCYRNKEQNFDTDFLNNHSVILIDSYFNYPHLISEGDVNHFLSAVERIRTKVIFTCIDSISVNIKHSHIRLLPLQKADRLQIIKGIFDNQNEYIESNLIDLLSELKFGSVRELIGFLYSLLAKQDLSILKIDTSSILAHYSLFTDFHN